jgi:hypothetical protein
VAIDDGDAVARRAGRVRTCAATGRRRGPIWRRLSSSRKRPPTEAALLRELDPHLLATLAFVHAQRAAGSGIQDFMGQSRLTATARAFHFNGYFARLGLWLVERHVLALRVGRERCSVSLSPIVCRFNRAMMLTTVSQIRR